MASTSMCSHVATMVQKYSTYLSRAYLIELLNTVLLQATTRKKEIFEKQRKEEMTVRDKQLDNVVALSLPFTHTEQYNCPAKYQSPDYKDLSQNLALSCTGQLWAD